MTLTPTHMLTGQQGEINVKEAAGHVKEEPEQAGQANREADEMSDTGSVIDLTAESPEPTEAVPTDPTDPTNEPLDNPVDEG